VVSARLRLGEMGPMSVTLDAAADVVAPPVEEEGTACPAEVV
jgi:hypothetical protein